METQPVTVRSLHDVRLHVLGEGDCFDLEERRLVVV